MTRTRAYALAVLERAVKTAAQAALLVLGADQINALHAQWTDVAGFAAGGFVLSLLTSLATSGFGGEGPSATTENVSPPAVVPGERGESALTIALVVLVVVVICILIFGR